MGYHEETDSAFAPAPPLSHLYSGDTWRLHSKASESSFRMGIFRTLLNLTREVVKILLKAQPPSSDPAWKQVERQIRKPVYSIS